MINRWYVLDLREGASLATALSAGAPWDTFCFDWGIPEDEDRYVSWDDVVARLDRVVRRVLRITGAPKVTLVGYSLGATLSGIHTALHPEQVAAFINLAGPFDFSEAGRLGTMADARWFDPVAMTAAGNLDAALLQSGFQALAPTDSVSRWVGLADAIHDPNARDAFAALETWVSDKITFPAAAFVTYIKELYQENRLIRGEHFVRGERVDLSRIACPVLSVVADRDTICPPKAAIALNDRVSSDVKRVLSVPGGHVSAVVGANAARDLYPKIRSWLEEHGTLPNARPPESRL
ncbi:MAG: alpha/beta fold hydrolase [Labilithrix sp.]|nr:alpha/beta fold hydrolase [Labilithrix sp.]MBX3225077.1 alpha/beta fold hydrolase [Labilithrix sp.]